jgi:transposase-like protein
MVARTLNFNNTKYSRRFIAKALGISSRDINRIVKKFRRMLRERLNR